ncbi:MAG TPA: hypothetical protein PK948_10345 [Gemmatimonadales bacterium]|nr:hypothetical protein [Gemmatimonadales bacterium]
MSLVETLSRLAEPWATAYADSKWIMNTVLFSHVAGFVVAGGFALASDRSLLRAAQAAAEVRAVRLADLEGVHRPVLIGLAVALLSGILLFLADVETFALAPVFWIKMAFLVLLLVNGARVRALGRRLAGGTAPDSAWASLQRAAVASTGLWLVAVLTGVMLVNL